MRTKILLSAVAALAIGVASTMAQTYSQNVVGYVNTTVPAGAYVPLGNSLINGNDANQTNNNLNACYTAGLISDSHIAAIAGDPSTGSNSVIYIWTGSFGNALYYFNAADATVWEGGASPAGWYDPGGTYYSSITVGQGQVAFLQNSVHSPAAMTATLTGNVFQGTNNSLSLVAGYNFVSYVVPIGGTNPVAQPFGLPLTMHSDPNPNGNAIPTQTSNDTIFTWNPAGLGGFNLGYYYFNAIDATAWEGFASPAGFYDQGGSPMPSSAFPVASQGFFLWHNGGTISWTPSFQVQ